VKLLILSELVVAYLSPYVARFINKIVFAKKSIVIVSLLHQSEVFVSIDDNSRLKQIALAIPFEFDIKFFVILY
jgi:hypothetical protein